jgi:hypothetical protein
MGQFRYPVFEVDAARALRTRKDDVNLSGGYRAPPYLSRLLAG